MDKMTREEAIRAYEEKFGGFPYFLFMTASDEYLIWEVRRSLRRGKKIEAPTPNVY